MFLGLTVIAAGWILWSQQSASWRSSHSKSLADTFLAWWPVILFGLAGSFLVAWPAGRRATKTAESRTNEPAGRWAATVSAITAMISVLVAGLTVAYTNNANREQLDLSQRGQIADRFSQAIDQLGQEDPDKLAVRLGGIYAMGQIMRDSRSDVDEAAIVDILSAFVRAHATDSKRESPTADVQAALTVLGKRPNFDKPNFGTVDLGGAALKGARLRGAHLEGAHLEHVLLDIADLDGAFLTSANLDGVILFNTSLAGAHLERADLTDACLDENTNLNGAHFDGVVLFHAHLENADLSGVLGLTSASVRDAYMNKNTKLPAGVGPPAAGTPPSC